MPHPGPAQALPATTRWPRPHTTGRPPSPLPVIKVLGLSLSLCDIKRPETLITTVLPARHGQHDPGPRPQSSVLGVRNRLPANLGDEPVDEIPEEQQQQRPGSPI